MVLLQLFLLLSPILVEGFLPARLPAGKGGHGVVTFIILYKRHHQSWLNVMWSYDVGEWDISLPLEPPTPRQCRDSLAKLPVNENNPQNGNVSSTGRVSFVAAKSTQTSDPAPTTADVLKDVGLLFERALDSVEDVGVHLRRATERDVARRFKQVDKLVTKSTTRKRVLILGTGWGGHALTKIIDDGLYEVIVVSPRNYFLFTPMLAGSSVGTVDFRSITEPIRQANPLVDYYEARCVEIFPHNNTIRVLSELPNEDGNKDSFIVPYDILVYAAGAQTNTFGIPGVKEHCHYLKEIPDAVELRTGLVDAFERANMPSVSMEEKKRILSFVVVGAGPTGVEFSGEFSDFLRRDLARFYPRLVSLVSFSIIQATGSILPVFQEALRQKGLEALLQKSIDVRLNTAVVEVRDRDIILAGNESIPYGLCVWAAGVGPRQLTRDLIARIPDQADSTVGKKGRLFVDGWHRVKGTNGTILALGDACELDTGALPGTGQVAAQQGAFVGRLLNRGFDLTSPIPRFPIENVTFLSKAANFIRLRGKLEADKFTFLNLGLLAYVGQSEALASVQTGNIKLGEAAGQAGNLLWRSVYVVKQVSTRNRIYVLLDWMKAKVFGRDISRF